MPEKISCIAIDDETPALQLIEHFVAKFDNLDLKSTFKSPIKAIEFLATQPVDLIFCDIQMAELNGLQLIKSITQKTMVIYVTAYSEFAFEAFELDAIDYLKKPFSFDRFTKAISKVNEHIEIKNRPDLDQSQITETDKNYLVAKVGYKTTKVFFQDILFVEAYQEYVKIFTITNKIILYERMKNMEKILPSKNFIRVHRSYIVAIDQVRSIAGNLLTIGEHQIPVSRENKNMVTKFIF